MNWKSIFAYTALCLALVLGGLALWYRAELPFVQFSQPQWLWCLLLPFFLIGWSSKSKTPKVASLRWSRSLSLFGQKSSLAARLLSLPEALRVTSFCLLIIALARPVSTRSSDHTYHEGIDIAVAIDLSESMAAQDLLPSRLAAAKAVLDAFIARRPHDRISMVAFGEQASTLAPLTLDHAVLRRLVRRIKLKVMDGTSTAIGAGIGLALNRLEESSSETRVIVLLTDGVQTADGLHPDAVAQEAASRGVKIFTVLIGKHQDDSVDPAQLERIAAATGGYAYTAADSTTLQSSFYDLLDRLETSRLEGKQVRAELFSWFLWPALFVLILDLVLRNTRLRSFP